MGGRGDAGSEWADGEGYLLPNSCQRQPPQSGLWLGLPWIGYSSPLLSPCGELKMILMLATAVLMVNVFLQEYGSSLRKLVPFLLLDLLLTSQQFCPD